MIDSVAMNAEAMPPAESRTDLSGNLYTFHGFRLLDVDGNDLGQVEWVWADDGDRTAEYLGVRLHWLRGTVRALPAAGAMVDLQRATVRVGYTRQHVMHARRYSIGRPLTAEQKRAIGAHYAPQGNTVRSKARIRAGSGARWNAASSSSR